MTRVELWKDVLRMLNKEDKGIDTLCTIDGIPAACEMTDCDCIGCDYNLSECSSQFWSWCLEEASPDDIDDFGTVLRVLESVPESDKYTRYNEYIREILEIIYDEI